MKYIMKYIFFILILAIPKTGVSQKVLVKSKLDTNIILIGDQIYYEQTVEQDKDVSIRFPVYENELAEGIEIIQVTGLDTTDQDGKYSVTRRLLLTVFDTGIYEIPPQPFLLQNNNISDTLFTAINYIDVKPVSIDTTNTIRTIAPIQEVPLTLKEAAVYFSGFLMLAIMGFLVYYFFFRKKTDTRKVEPRKPEEPYYVTALRELDKLKAQKLWQQKKEKEYYSQITHIIRTYISKQFSIPALEMTSNEILLHVKRRQTLNINFNVLEELLNLADLVKFAKEEPLPEENIAHLENAVEFVRNTSKVNRESSETLDVNKESNKNE